MILGPSTDTYNLFIDVANKTSLSEAIRSHREVQTADYVVCDHCVPQKQGPATRVNEYSFKGTILVVCLKTDQMAEPGIQIDNFTFNKVKFYPLAAIEYTKGPIGHWTAWLKNKSTWWVCTDAATQESATIPPRFFSLVVAFSSV